MPQEATELDFDTLTLSWPLRGAGADEFATKNQLVEFLEDRLPDNEAGYTVTGSGIGLDTADVGLAADAGRGHELLAWVRGVLRDHPLPAGAQLTLNPSHGQSLSVPLTSERPN